MPNGAIYILTKNERYVDLALQSVASLKRAMPDLPVTVFSQFPMSSPLVERVVPVQPTRDGFYDKTKLMQESPYDRTLFIDADIIVVEPFPELFGLLDRFDCAATHEEYVNTDWFNRYPRSDVPSSFPEFNTGILLFKRSTKMDGVLKEWEALYAQFLKEKPDQQINDQPFFRVALYYSEARVATLTREYNCKFRGQGYLNGPVKLLHGHVDLQFDSRQLAQATHALNASLRPRVYIAGRVYDQKLTGRLVGMRKAHRIGTFPIFPGSLMVRRVKRLRQVIKEQGLKKILAKLLPKNGRFGSLVGDN
ncbi:MAG: glycosyltransferase [Terriglobales bacterium]